MKNIRDVPGGLKGPQGGIWGWVKFFSPKDAFHLDNSNVTSFSSIGRRDGKLFNFLTFLDILGGQKGPQGGLGGGRKEIFAKRCILLRQFK